MQASKTQIFIYLWLLLFFSNAFFFQLQTETVELLTFIALWFCGKIFSHPSGRIGIFKINCICQCSLFSPIWSIFMTKIIGQTLANFNPNTKRQNFRLNMLFLYLMVSFFFSFLGYCKEDLARLGSQWSSVSTMSSDSE